MVAIDALRWLVVVAFGLSAAEKAITLKSKSARWHPVFILTRLRRRYARSLMGAVLAADIVAATLLIFRPRVGGFVAAALIGSYSIAALPLYRSAQGGPCRCFWRVMEVKTKKAFVARNAVLVAAAALIFAFPPSRTVVGVLLGAGATALTAVAWLLQTQEPVLNEPIASSTTSRTRRPMSEVSN